MDSTRAQLENELAKLDGLMKALRADYLGEADFWVAFACLVDAIEERVPPPDCQWWSERLEELMAHHRLVANGRQKADDG